MGKANDLTGQKFGRLTVIKRIGRSKWRTPIWLCQCECGNYIEVLSTNLVGNSTKSCGCLRKSQLKTHGLSYTKLYPIWIAIKDRCFNKQNNEFCCYGGRGITICSEWKDSFQSFYDWAIQNGYKKGLTIDRIDNNGNYEPNNCRWATIKEQSRNRRNNHLITYNNETHTLIEWAEILGIKERTLNSRINKLNWTIEKAFTQKG